MPHPHSPRREADRSRPRDRSPSRDRTRRDPHTGRDREDKPRTDEAGSSRRSRDVERSPAPRRRDRSVSRSRSPAPRGRDRPPSRDRSKDRHKRRHRRSPSASSSESDDSRDDRKKRHRSRSRSRDRGGKGKESREEKKERKRLKKEKRERKRAKKEAKADKDKGKGKKKGAVTEYGKYGIITEANIYDKDTEFRTWLVEERTLNPETISAPKMKELFRSYMEDYNTATLPHEKFYALDKYENRMNAIRAGETVTDTGGYDPRADEAALSARSKVTAKNDGEILIGRRQLEELRQLERQVPFLPFGRFRKPGDRVEASRMKRMGMEVKESMGVRYERD